MNPAIRVQIPVGPPFFASWRIKAFYGEYCRLLLERSRKLLEHKLLIKNKTWRQTNHFQQYSISQSNTRHRPWIRAPLIVKVAINIYRKALLLPAIGILADLFRRNLHTLDYLCHTSCIDQKSNHLLRKIPASYVNYTSQTIH